MPCLCHGLKILHLCICRLTCLPQVCQGKRRGFEPMQKVADDTTRHWHRLAPQDRRPRRRPEGPRSGWAHPIGTLGPRRQSHKLLAATQPEANSSYPRLPPRYQIVGTEKQLTAPADRPVRDPAHAVAFTTAMAIGGTGSSDRRAAVASAVTRTGYRNRPGSPPATDSRQVPPLASAGVAGYPGAVLRRPPSDGGTPPRVAVSRSDRGDSVNCRNLQRMEVQMILKEPHARAA